MDNKKIELLNKLRKLAESGVGGEKVNAQKMLDKLMEKYGITDADLDSHEIEDDVTPHEFWYKNYYEKILLMQTIYKVTNSSIMISYRRQRTLHKIGCECTTLQAMEIEFLYDFYKRVFYKDAELLLQAFIQKHKIFGTRSDDDKDQDLDQDTLRKIFAMSKYMSDDVPPEALLNCGPLLEGRKNQ